MSKPLAVIVGITGKQGGSVADHLLRSGKYRLRGLTRNPESSKATSLKEKGIELVKADIGNKGQVLTAFKDADAAFLVTNFWDPEVLKDNSLEEKQGRTLVDAAVESGVKHVIWSSLSDVDAESGGKIKVPHFTGKNKVEQYLRTKDVIKTMVYPGFYSSNFQMFQPKEGSDGVKTLSLPVRPDAKVPFFDTGDTGKYVLKVLEGGKEYDGKRIFMFGSLSSFSEATEIWSRVGGETIKYQQLPDDVFLKSGMPEELFYNLKWISDFGYFGQKSDQEIEEGKTFIKDPTTIEKWLKNFLGKKE